MKELEMLYEGKVKRVLATKNPDQVVIDCKDDATAFNDQKRGTILGKGVVNNKIADFLFKELENKEIPTHLIEELDDRRTLVKKMETIPLEVTIRNEVAGSSAKRMGLKEGMELEYPALEFSCKDDDLGGPMINNYMAFIVGISAQEEIGKITRLAFAANEEPKSIFAAADTELISFESGFGRSRGGIVLADEISPDTCRFWNIHTYDHLDKDCFRRNLRDVKNAYQEIYRRLGIK